MTNRTALVERLKEKGLRVTQQRVAVLEYLCSTPTHPTADEIGTAVNRAAPTTSRASVYNVLHSLTSSGLVEELVFEDAVARYDANLGPHHHFVCTRCHAVHDVPEDAIPLPPKKKLASGHVVECVDVTLRGLCPRCAATP